MVDLNLEINIGILLAAAVTASATYRSWKSQERRDKADRPTVNVSGVTMAEKAGVGIISFSLDDRHRIVWRIESVSVRRPLFVKLIQPYENPTIDPEYGGLIYTASPHWKRSLKLRRDLKDHVIFVRADRSASAALSFNLSMKADSSETSRFIERISITD